MVAFVLVLLWVLVNIVLLLLLVRLARERRTTGTSEDNRRAGDRGAPDPEVDSRTRGARGEEIEDSS